MTCTLYGRSSSHFTRVTRIFAAELQVPYTLEVVRDLLSIDTVGYGGNPALKLPTLHTTQGPCYGALNICRAFARLSAQPHNIIWPEQLTELLPCNAQELVSQAMSTEVSWLLAQASASRGQAIDKLQHSLHGSLQWLDQHAEQALLALPAARHLSFLEVTLFCLLTHLEFRQVLSLQAFPRLQAYAQRFGQRPSALATAYQFDV